MTKTLHDLLFIKRLKKSDVTCLFTNDIQQVSKRPQQDTDPDSQKYQNIWYLKNVGSEEDVASEILAQELFRLILPRHPKTRVIADDQGKLNFLISKSIEGNFKCLDDYEDDEKKIQFKNKVYKGLGEICVMALFVNEVDLKFGNLFVNDKHELIKIDGNFCFDNGKHNQITANDIRTLPIVKQYEAGNWLDIWYDDKGKDYHRSFIFSKSFSYDILFRCEVNRTLMKVMMLPPALLEFFVLHVITNFPPKIIGYLLKEVLNRQADLVKAALEDRAFRKYMLREEMLRDFEEFISELKNFKMIGKETLHMQEYEAMMRNKVDIMVRTIKGEDNRNVGFFKSTQEVVREKKRKHVEIEEKQPGLWDMIYQLFWPTEQKPRNDVAFKV